MRSMLMATVFAGLLLPGGTVTSDAAILKINPAISIDAPKSQSAQVMPVQYFSFGFGPGYGYRDYGYYGYPYRRYGSYGYPYGRYGYGGYGYGLGFPLFGLSPYYYSKRYRYRRYRRHRH